MQFADSWTAQAPAIPAALLIGVLLLTWRFGRGPERALACLMFAFVLVDPVQTTVGSGGSEDATNAVRDGLVLFGVGIVALRANRLYPLFMAGAALVAVLANLMYWSALLKGRFSYMVLTAVPSYLMVSALLIGFAFHIRRERKNGPYPAWKMVPRSASNCRIAEDRLA